MRLLLVGVLLSSAIFARAGEFTLHIKASGPAEEVVSLYRYADLFTRRPALITRSILGADGTTTLRGDVEGTALVQLRIGDRTSDLFIRPGSSYTLETMDLGLPRSLNGTTRMGLSFIDLPPLDINALTSDVNERIDAFIAEDLATDEAAGMQVLDIQRKAGYQPPDSSERPPTLFVTPSLSEARIDTFSAKLQRFYADVNDPWFDHYLEYSIAGMRLGPRVNERSVFEEHLQGRPLHYDDPEYVRFIRSFFSDRLEQIHLEQGEVLREQAAKGMKDPLRALFQQSDFLRNDDRLAELVMVDRLYLDHSAGMVPKPDAEAILRDVAVNSTYTEHRTIASNMLWDLTNMRAGTALPVIRTEDEHGATVDLNALLDGPVCLAITAGWCTYCATEIAGLVQLADLYPGVVRVIVIGLDKTLEEFNALRKSTPKNSFTWLHAEAEQQLREDLRLRSIPAFYLLNDDILARSPAPLPSKGLGDLFHKAKVEADRQGRIKVWDD